MARFLDIMNAKSRAENEARFFAQQESGYVPGG